MLMGKTLMHPRVTFGSQRSIESRRIASSRKICTSEKDPRETLEASTSSWIGQLGNENQSST